MRNSLLPYLGTAAAAALLGAGAAYLALTGTPGQAPGGAVPPLAASLAPAQQGTRIADARQKLLFETTMDDVLGRVVTIREFERDPGTGSTAHRHPGSHTFGYVLQGTYEVQVGDGPLQRLGPGQTFHETPGALHAVSRNGSSTEPVRYLVIQVSDPTLPATVPEP